MIWQLICARKTCQVSQPCRDHRRWLFSLGGKGRRDNSSAWVYASSDSRRGVMKA
ncbi:hypothetical protein D918_06870 [Trichuris suis]|nr:hypothetical protein D918_06870 [Trichuris suis]